LSHSIDDASTDAIGNDLVTQGTFENPARIHLGNDYQAPSAAPGTLARAVLAGWSLDGFSLAGSAPPVDLVGART
jgi:hypothetical protein